MSKLIRHFEQEIESLRSELRNVTRACNASKSEPALSGIDNEWEKECKRLKMEREILDNEKRDFLKRQEAFLESERKRLVAVVLALEAQIGIYTNLK